HLLLTRCGLSTRDRQTNHHLLKKLTLATSHALRFVRAHSFGNSQRDGSLTAALLFTTNGDSRNWNQFGLAFLTQSILCWNAAVSKLNNDMSRLDFGVKSWTLFWIAACQHAEEEINTTWNTLMTWPISALLK
ncbi:MAG: hypothetical protein WBO37_16410, partial [Gammaproteobacteria bacterium]